MKTLEKISPMPTFKSFIEDFWNADGFLTPTHFSKNTYPTVNIVDHDNAYELTVSAPGFKKDDFKIALENGLVTITAETSAEKKEEKKNYLRKEFQTSSFARSFRMPENTTEEQIHANYQDGLLKINITKTKDDKKTTKEIPIQ